jgi:hypothetical protein
MPEPHPDPRRDLRAIAVLTALAFGCATVRVPAGQIADPIPVRDGVAEPQVALVIEDSKGVDPAESARATQAARAALAAAGAEQGAVDGNAILVVRAQGVTRTPSRRSDQRLAVAGIVAGAVVVVAAAVVAVIATRGKGSGGSRVPKPAPKAAAAPASAPRPSPAPAPRGAPAPVRAAPSPAPSPGAPQAPARPAGGFRPAPAPGAGPVVAGDGHVHGGVDVSVGFWIDAHGQPAPPPTPTLVGHDVVEPAALAAASWDAPSAPRELAASEPEPLQAISLAPPEPINLEPRGFFAGDELLLELVLVDRRDGTPLWRKVSHRRDVNPTDARAVKDALRAALAEGTWMPATDLAVPPSG